MKTKQYYIEEMNRRVQVFNEALIQGNPLLDLYAMDIANAAQIVAKYDESVMDKDELASQ